MFYQPLTQFEISIFQPYFFEIYDYLVDFNSMFFFIPSSFIYLVITILILYTFFYVSILNNHVIPNTGWEYITEFFYQFIYNILFQQVGKEGTKYFPLIFALFLFILVCNFIGMVPYGFTTTAFLVKTFTLSFSFLIGINIIGFQQQGLGFLKLFVPKGVPAALLPFIVLIEIISHLIKPVSLGVRLFANLMSGHSLLNILSSFVLGLSKIHFFFGLIPFIVVLLVCFLEVGIAFLQAYVFCVLLCIYLNEGLHGH